jgi:uncharacterized protein YgiM (DUF1202 family)
MSRFFSTAVVAAMAVAAGAASAGTIAVPSPQVPESGYQTVADIIMTVTATSANLRANPSPQAHILTRLPKGTRVTVKSKSATSRWVRVQANGAEGYIDSKLLK